MAVLVTGSMGHVGFEVVRQAAARNLDVIAQYRGTFRPADAESVGKSVKWVACDLTDQASVEKLVSEHQIEGCIHGAAVPNELYCRPDPLNAVQVNVTAIARLLDMARKQGWRRLLHVSTGSVFQNISDTSKQVAEDTQPGVSTIYSTTKYCGELLTSMYRSQFSVPAATVRISWVYGPPMVPKEREDPRGPIPWFLKCAMTGVPVEEANGGDFGASFTHVSDVAGGLIAAYEAKTLNHDIYHLGSGVNYSTSEVAAAVKAAVPGAVVNVGPGTRPWTDLGRMRGPLGGDRLFNDSGWKPALSLEAGVKSFADWIRAHPEVLK